MLSCAGYEYCFSLNNREKQIRTAHRCAPKVATAHLPPPPAPSPAAGEGASIQTAAYPTHRLGIMTSCYRFAVTPHKMRRRYLESVSAALYGRCLGIVRIQPQLSVRGSWGTAPSVFWFLLYAQKERPGGEPYRPSPSGDFAPPLGDYNLSPPGRRTGRHPPVTSPRR